MSRQDFSQVVDRLTSLSYEELLAIKNLIETKIESTPIVPNGLGSIGAMSDAADELDEVVAEAMRNRETRPSRAALGE